MRRPGPIDVALLLFTAATWGSVFAAIKVLVGVMHPMSVAASRVAIAAAALGAVVAARGSGWPADKRTYLHLFGIGALGFALPFTLIAFAETRLSSASTGILMSVGPLAGSVVSHLTSKDDRLSTRKVLGLLLGFCGAAWLIQIDQGDFGGSSWWPRVAVVASAVCYALAGNWARRLTGVRPDAVTAGALASAAIILLPGLWLAPSLPTELTIEHAAAMIYLGLVPTALAYVIRFRQMTRIHYTFVSFAGYLVPVFAAFWGFVLLHEPVNLETIGALLVILLGIALA